MNNYPYVNNMYLQDLQNMRDRIDRQMMQIQPQVQNQQTPAISQTFQLNNPQNNLNDFDSKCVSSVDEVKNTLTIKNTLFVNKEMSTLWLKDATGKIKSYTLTEIVELDEKDKMILNLQKQIEELKGVVLNAKSIDVNADESATKQKPSDVSNDKYGKK